MNNTVLKILAAVLALGAVVVAILGVRLSQQPKPVTSVQDAAPTTIPTEAVVVAARLIKAGKALGPADVVIKGLPSPPPQAFRQTQDLLGKVPMADIQPGTTLQPAQFATDTLANLLRPGERAIAVMVDEVVGLGGFAKPGDHVDVLAYVPVNRESNTLAFSQIVVQNARVLTFGDTTQMDVDHDKSAESLSQEAKEKSGAKNAQEMKERRMGLRSAVLALPEAETTRLMLAASSGTLRLALRPQATVQADPLGMYPAGTRITAVTSRQTVITPDLAPSTVIRAPLSSDAASVDTSSGIVIQEGSKERRLAKNGTSTQP